jgi:uncharacterized membrane protein
MKHAEERAQYVQNRIADRITTFAGSMNFVYLHIALFAIWMILLEKKPWPTLTLVVSLEAIFLSTFVMISQNRADEKRQVVAAEEWRPVGKEAAVRRTLESSPRASDHGGTTPHDSLRDREVLPGGSFWRSRR